MQGWERGWERILSSAAVALVIASTFMHAAWNILARRKGGTQVVVWRMQLVIIAGGAIPAAVCLALFPCISARALLSLLGSGVSCGFYYVCLARGYESGDFTTVYPAARALPVLLLGVADVVRGQPPTPAGWVGMALVASGCLFVPLTSFRSFRLRHYLKPASLWIVLTALGTVGYSVFDKLGTGAIPRGPYACAVYCYLFFVVAGAAYLPIERMVGRQKASRDVGWCLPAVAGVLGFLAYWLVLWAYQLTDRVSYVVAFRQFGIVIGVVAAFVLFREPGRTVRLVGTGVITLGLILLKVLGT